MKRTGILFILLLIFLSSCARPPIREPRSLGSLEPYEPFPIIPEPERVVTSPEIVRGNIFHEVAPGETVWRIAKMYDVSISDIVRANRLTDASSLEKGERLLIPSAAPWRAVVSLYPSNKWKYIVIHHSGTEVGKALAFDKVHSSKRKWKGLGYHFVIDNGTSGKADGQIEVSPRWIHQDDGAHCKAGGMNYRGIGVCLVGNFNDDIVTEKQMESLVFLVNTLRDYYNIPKRRILGHGEVDGASTDCPGNAFPWPEFWRRLNP